MNIEKEFAIPIIQRPVSDDIVLWLSGRIRDSDIRLRDLSKYGNSDDIVGATWTNTPLNHSCLSFDGVDDYVDMGNGASLNITTNITIEGWVNITSFSQRFTLLGKWVLGSENYAMEINETTKRISIFNRTDAGFVQTGNVGIQLNTGTWYHVVGIYDGNYLRVYVNGIEQTTSAQSGTPLTNSSNLIIGGLTTTTQLGIGLIDEVRIYNRALSAGEVMERYENTKYLFGY